jgi:hypothetical protein
MLGVSRRRRSDLSFAGEGTLFFGVVTFFLERVSICMYIILLLKTFTIYFSCKQVNRWPVV